MEEPSNTLFKNFPSTRWEEPYLYGRMSFHHRNSFEALIDQKENEYRLEGHENNDKSSALRSHFFEYLTNPAEEGPANPTNFSNNDSFDELHLHSQHSTSMDGLMDIGEDDFGRNEGY